MSMTDTESLSGFTTQTCGSPLVMVMGLELVCGSSTGLANSGVDWTPSAATRQRQKQRGWIMERTTKSPLVFIDLSFRVRAFGCRIHSAPNNLVSRINL